MFPLFGEDLKICYDKSSIDALDFVRQRKTESMLNSTVLTINEKRELLGLAPREEAEADQLYVDPSLLPMGFEAFTQEEQAASDAAKAFMRMGMKRSVRQKLKRGGSFRDNANTITNTKTCRSTAAKDGYYRGCFHPQDYGGAGPSG